MPQPYNKNQPPLDAPLEDDVRKKLEADFDKDGAELARIAATKAATVRSSR